MTLLVSTERDDWGGRTGAGPLRDEGTTQPMVQRRLRQLDASQRARLGSTLVIIGLVVLIVGVWFNHYANFSASERRTIDAQNAIGRATGGTVDVGDGEMRTLASTPRIEDGAEFAQVDVEIDVDYFGWVPRGCMAGDNSSLVSTAPIIGVADANWCLPWFTLGHVVALIGTQLMVAGLAIALILGRRMTWALATFAAFLAFFELVMFMGTVPSEWLNLAQGPLGWTEQNIAFPRDHHPQFLQDAWNFIFLNNNIQISWGFVKDFISVNFNMGVLTAVIIIAWKFQDWSKPLTEEAPEEAPVSPYGRPLVKLVD